MTSLGKLAAALMPHMPNRAARRANHKALIARMEEELACRPCDTCTACCTALGVAELRKEPGTPCRYLRPEAAPKACDAYKSRPRSCREFYCGWRLGFFGDDPTKRPDVFGVVVRPNETGGVPFLLAMEAQAGALERAREELEGLAHEMSTPIVLGRPGSEQAEVVGPADLVQRLNDAARRVLPLAKGSWPSISK